MMKIEKTCFLMAVFCFMAASVMAQDATELVKRADAKMRGEKSSYSEMRMTIVRPTWNRTIGFKSWTKEQQHSLVYITSPAKEKGQTFLKRDRDMWSWNPTISRLIKMPTSMLSQGWMGSDFTNDDLLNQSSIVVDYSHKLVGEDVISGEDSYKIELIPLEDAPVVWGKVNLWISKKDEIQMKAEYYDEDGYLVKTETTLAIKEMGGRTIPTEMELVPADEEDNKTIVMIDKIEFNIDIDDTFFSQQNMKRVR